MIDPGYTALRQRLIDLGCFDYRPWRAVLDLLLTLGCAAALMVAAAGLGWPYAAPLFVLGSVVFFRLGYLMHDGAHGGVFGDPARDRRFTAIACACLGAVPSGWRYGHNRHHAAPNVRGIDGDQSERWQPDARYHSYLAAFLALLIFRRVGGVRLPRSVLMLWIRDGLYARRHAPERFRRELLGAVFGQLLQLAFFGLVFGAWGLPLYLLHTHIGLVFLNAVFLGNHYDLPSFDAPEHRALESTELQIVTSRNYPPSRLGDLFHGGLGYQIEHHLFPDLPRHGLRRAAPHVRAYCAARGLPYNEAPFLECILRALRYHVVRPAQRR